MNTAKTYSQQLAALYVQSAASLLQQSIDRCDWRMVAVYAKLVLTNVEPLEESR